MGLIVITCFPSQKQQVRNRLDKHVAEEKQLRQKLAVASGEPIGDVAQSVNVSSVVTSANGTKSGVGAKRPLEPSVSTSLVSDKKLVTYIKTLI